MTQQQIQEQAEKLQFDEIIKMKSVILFMPHFNRNVNLIVKKNFVDNNDKECFTLKGKLYGNTILSETIFCQQDLDEMMHIFKPKQ